MTFAVSQNTKAILLLTAPLIVGRSHATDELLSHGEYKRLARLLKELKKQPADLLQTGDIELRNACRNVVDTGRLDRLIARGFLLSQAVEKWSSRAIWVISRADPSYPRRLKTALREDAPAVLYGCGDIALADVGGLAVVGSRHVDDALVESTRQIGELSARAGKVVVSGGARGIDQSAMGGALDAGGQSIGVLADSLERAVMRPEHRDLLLDGRLLLISPFDPNAGFNVGNAMQRNKLVYALSDVALVVSSDLGKGGTWTGAVEQLEKLRLVPVYTRVSDSPSPGLDALRKKGAIPWPDPQDVDSLLVALAVRADPRPANGVGPGLFDQSDTDPMGTLSAEPDPSPIEEVCTVGSAVAQPDSRNSLRAGATTEEPASMFLSEVPLTPAEQLFCEVRKLVRLMLSTPMTERDVADLLDVSAAQTKVWLARLVDEGVLEKKSKPTRYTLAERSLFE